MFNRLFGSDKQSASISQGKTLTVQPTSGNFAGNTLAAAAPKSPSVFPNNTPVKLTTNDYGSDENIELAIQAAYRQVFGNVRLMESERLVTAESQLRSGQVSVKEFVGLLAKSEQYQALFWNTNTNIKAIELNFKHLLGRAPENYQEISRHIEIIAEGGFAAEIDSYLDSEEYNNNFGETIVPYYRGYTTQTGNSLAGYIYSVSSATSSSSSDSSTTQIASIKLLIDSTKDKPATVSTSSYTAPRVAAYGSSGPRPSDFIPEDLIQKYCATGRSSSGRRPVSVDQRFMDMARNTPAYLKARRT